MDRWCFLWSHAQALKQTVQFQPMKFLYGGSGESSQFSSQWCKVWISFSFVVNLKSCWTNSLYDSEYIAYFWFTHEMCCCLYCDVQNETTGVILCWLIVDLFENRPCSCHSRHSKRSISWPPPCSHKFRFLIKRTHLFVQQLFQNNNNIHWKCDAVRLFVQEPRNYQYSISLKGTFSTFHPYTMFIVKLDYLFKSSFLINIK